MSIIEGLLGQLGRTAGNVANNWGGLGDRIYQNAYNEGIPQAIGRGTAKAFEEYDKTTNPEKYAEIQAELDAEAEYEANAPIRARDSEARNMRKFYDEGMLWSQLDQNLALAQKTASHDATMETTRMIQGNKDHGVTLTDMKGAIDLFPLSDEQKAQQKSLAESIYKGPANPFEVFKDQQISDIQTSVDNFSNGRGDGTGTVKPETPKDPKGDYERNVVDTLTNKNMRDQVPLHWYDSDAFNVGLIQFGLGLMSGKGYSDSFNLAAESFDTLYQREKRERFADELRSEGYPEANIMEWIQSGKSNLLTKPKPTEQWEMIKKDVGGVDMYGQQNMSTGKIDWVDASTLKQYGLGGGGSGSGKTPFADNSQITIGSKVMPAAAAGWQRAWGNVKPGEYPMESVHGKFSEAMGTKDFLGRIVNQGDVSKARSAEIGWLQSYGRPLSGGAITDSEWYDWGQMLFPRSGDNSQDYLRKQFMRDHIANVISTLTFPPNMNDEQKAEYESRVFQTTMGQSANVASNITGYDNNTGWYSLADGSYWHPQYGVAKE